MNICIISDCNNNCKFCFQQEFHRHHEMLTFDEIKDIYEWGKPYEGRDKVGILGGEPTLHPDICKIFEFLQGKMYIMTNLLCDTSIIECALSYSTPFLINSIHSDHNHELFLNNLKLFERILSASISIRPPAIGITLYDDEEENEKMIKNLLEYKKEFPKTVAYIRVGLATPYSKEFKFINYDKWVKKVVSSFKEYPEMGFGFDCPPNECQISYALREELKARGNFNHLVFTHCINPAFDVCTDKRVIYCSSFPKDLWESKYYYEYRNKKECFDEMQHKAYEYYKNNYKLCNNRCHSKTCKNACISILGRIKKGNII